MQPPDFKKACFIIRLKNHEKVPEVSGMALA
jgi:hypothetical protein